MNLKSANNLASMGNLFLVCRIGSGVRDCMWTWFQDQKPQWGIITPLQLTLAFLRVSFMKTSYTRWWELPLSKMHNWRTLPNDDGHARFNELKMNANAHFSCETARRIQVAPANRELRLKPPDWLIQREAEGARDREREGEMQTERDGQAICFSLVLWLKALQAPLMEENFIWSHWGPTAHQSAEKWLSMFSSRDLKTCSSAACGKGRGSLDASNIKTSSQML